MGFPARLSLPILILMNLFQSLVGVYGFSRLYVLIIVRQLLAFQSLVGVYGFSRRRCLKRLLYLVFKVHLRDCDLKVPFQPSVCQYPIFHIAFKFLCGMGFSDRGNRFFDLLASNPCSVCITASKFNTPIFTPTDQRTRRKPLASDTGTSR